MQVIVFFNSLEKVSNVIRTLEAQKENLTEFHLFSLAPLSDEELALSIELEYSVHSCSNTKDALQQASKCIILGIETVVTLDTVIPLSDWHTQIVKYKAQYPEMNVAFGRWYREAIADRQFVSNERLGFKFKDAIPALIGNYVFDHFPDPTSYCVQVTRFPIFFNWFSVDMAPVIKACMNTANSVSEMSHFLADYSEISKEKGSYYYLPSIEILDQRLLK